MARRPVDTPYTITTEFGVPDSNALFKYHSGVDYAVGTGRLIYAPVAGTITYARFHNVRGNMVGIFDGVNTHRLMHNSSFAVREGQQVSEGQVVAYAGSTGLSTGPHCHWDIIRGNKIDAAAFSDFINPASWLASATSTPQPTQGGINVETLKSMYWRLLGREADAGGLSHYSQEATKNGWEFVYNDLKNSAEGQNDWNRRNPERVRILEQTIVDLQTALRNEQNKPAKEVIKEVEKIVEKPVEVIKEVPVYTHDQETKTMITAIFNYFVGQFKTFQKYNPFKKG
jgi:hypothetical protein